MVKKEQSNNTINQQEYLNNEGLLHSQQDDTQWLSSMQQQYTYVNNNEPQPIQRKPPILGIISIILVFIAFFVSVFIPVIGIVLCILIIIFDIIALVRKEKAILLPIIGIILGVFVFMFSGILALIDWPNQMDTLQYVEDKDVFSGRILTMSDGSALYLQMDGTYSWYQDDSVQDDNYYAGSYKVYNANAAEYYIVNDLSKYGIEEDELDEFFKINSDDKYYTKDNLYCVAINCNYRLVDGEENTNEDSLTPYYGFSDGTIYDMVNMNTGNYLTIEGVMNLEVK